MVNSKALEVAARAMAREVGCSSNFADDVNHDIHHGADIALW